jgi:ketosteroid isomerase-like protein
MRIETMLSTEEQQNLELAKRYIELVADPSSTLEDLKPLFDEQIVWREMPNTFAPKGRTSDFATATASFQKGRAFLPKQTYTIRYVMAAGDTVAMEISWTGEVAQEIGPFAAGTLLSAELATFIRFREGKIVSQTDYPCYYPVDESKS